MGKKVQVTKKRFRNVSAKLLGGGIEGKRKKGLNPETDGESRGVHGGWEERVEIFGGTQKGRGWGTAAS